MRKYVIMGVQGSGKGTQGVMLARDFDLTQISVGDILRWNVQNHTKLGAQVRRIMAAGALVDDDLVESVVRGRLTDYDLIAHRPEAEDRCDVCGGKLVSREDDTEEALAARLRDYHEKTNPVLELFARKEFIFSVDARPDTITVQQAIRHKLGLPRYEP